MTIVRAILLGLAEACQWLARQFGRAAIWCEAQYYAATDAASQ